MVEGNGLGDFVEAQQCWRGDVARSAPAFKEGLDRINRIAGIGYKTFGLNTSFPFARVAQLKFVHSV
jgi:hypothetical protein